MRNLLVFAILFVFTIIVIPHVFAQTQEETATEAASRKVAEYQLPYPGILPDNPLYFLKMIRDRVVKLLISDPVKKAEFSLLQADKRLNAGLYLFEKGEEKYDTAITTISKAENYFDEALRNVEQAQKQEEDLFDLSSRLSISAQKHSQILKSLEEKTKGDNKNRIANERKRTEAFVKKASSLRPTK